VQTDYPEPDLCYDLAMGAGDDPYDGFDRFGRIVDSRWYDCRSSADVDRIFYGYDRAGNRTYREQTCDSNSYHDEVYSYDGLNRLTDFDRGTMNGNKDAISALKFAQQWSLDPTGNWSGFKEDSDGDSTWDLDQSRTSNVVNEITDIAETSGPAWATPVYNRAGNMTTVPKPADPTSSFAATYDAWNRLVTLEEGEDTIAEYVYDGAKRRVVKKTYGSGQLDETRHYYYTDPQKWQVIEERIETGGQISANPDRQFIWGLRYIDELVLRDRDTDANGSLDERLYALQDANWNVTALANTSGDVQERYAYSAYGTPRVLTPSFTTRASGSYDAEVCYASYRYDQATRLYHIRHRVYQPELGCWVQRDPIGYRRKDFSLYRYVGNSPLTQTDPTGMNPVVIAIPIAGGVVVVTAAEAAAAAFGLSVTACLLHAPCRDAMMRAIEDAVSGLSESVLSVLRAACAAQHTLYKATESLCQRCMRDPADTFVARVCRCSHATTNLACHEAAAAQRLAYIVNGCDFVSPTGVNHYKAWVDRLDAVTRCIVSAANNCGLTWGPPWM
jgi:RHS repeat-associated protein